MSTSRFEDNFDELNFHDVTALAYSYGLANTGDLEFWFNLERRALEEIGDGNLKGHNFSRLVAGFAAGRAGKYQFWDNVTAKSMAEIGNMNPTVLT